MPLLLSGKEVRGVVSETITASSARRHTGRAEAGGCRDGSEGVAVLAASVAHRVLDGDLNQLIRAYLMARRNEQRS